MKRSTDEIRYFILKGLKNQKNNIENIRLQLNTGLPTVLQNSRILEKMGFIKIYETKIGKRAYRELEITKDGRRFFERIKKIFED